MEGTPTPAEYPQKQQAPALEYQVIIYFEQRYPQTSSVLSSYFLPSLSSYFMCSLHSSNFQMGKSK
jgi:hypothetical protein